MTAPKKEETRKDYRYFGLLVGGAFLAIGGLFYWRDLEAAYRVAAVLGLLLVVPGLLAPSWLKYPYRGWMKFAAGAAWFNTRVILTLLFYLVLTPVGLLLKLLGKTPLALDYDPEAETYWIRREKEEFDPERCEKHF